MLHALPRLPSWRDWLFSIKAFTASMLALYIAMALGLPRPYWAMATVYVVAHPLIGATRSKGLYRAGGTLIGAGAALILTPLLDQTPVLFSLAIALWTGTLLYVSMLDRTPRSYLFMLAAYSLPLIALPAVSAPDRVFDIAVARSEEILVGITCASVVGAIAWPGKVAPVLAARVDAWLHDAADWAAELLSPQEGRRSTGSRHQLAADILMLDQYIGQLSYDASTATVVHQARQLRERLSMLLPLLSSIDAAVQNLRQQPAGMPEALTRLQHELSDWLLQSMREAPDQARANQLNHALDALQPQSSSPARENLLASHLCARLRSLIALWQDCLTLHGLIAGTDHSIDWEPLFHRHDLSSQARHYDFGMMLFSAASASLYIFLLCMVWIWSGWDDGGSAVIMGAIASCFFAAQDEPAQSQRAFFIWNVVCMVLAAVLLFLVIPASHDFETLVMAMALPFLLVGTLATKPQFALIAMTLTVSTASVMGLSGAYNADFTAFINSTLASTAGILFALIWTLLTRPFGAQLALRRLVYSWWADLARTAAGEHTGDHADLSARMRDRLSLLLPRLAASGDDQLTDGFSELRVGLSVLALQSDEHQLPPSGKQAVHRVLQQVAAHYRTRRNGSRLEAAPGSLAQAVSDAVKGLMHEHGPSIQTAQTTLHALTELRLTLCHGRATA